MTRRDLGAGGRRERAEEVFFAALDRAEAERAGFVAARCQGDSELERTVVSLLMAYEQTGPFDRLQGEFVRVREELLGAGEAGGTAPDVSPDELVVSPGMRLGRYEIRGRLGSGGMGEVFRAYDPRLERSVALKVIGRRLEADSEMLERFQLEARTASALAHPNIITVYDFGEQAGHPFLVMELVDGESLRSRLDTPLPVDEILRLSIQLADGLAAAHGAGVVHRDLKPENIVIDPGGTVRILDFGLAFFRAMGSRSHESFSSGGRTYSFGPAVGTVGYIAPEVLCGHGADHRSDQFALGAILYEMATGRSPFGRETVPAGLVATLRDDPTPVRKLREDVPGGLVEIIERCLAKRPTERYLQTAEILTALRTASTGKPRPKSQRGSLPTPITPLYGRREEIHQLQSLIVDDHVRLVTLSGVGGSGKTRLAVEAARQLTPEFPGGVVFVPLAGIQDPGLVVPTIAAAAGGTEAGGLEPPDLLAVLSEAEGPALLVLDNFEHVIEAGPHVGNLLEACPDVTVMVTSREVLHLRAEHDFAVAPLGLPSSAAAVKLEELDESPAVALFVGRARAAKADFRLTEDNAPDVVELCHRLEGLPLALELAAARIRTLSPRAMLQRLENRMGLLTGGPRDLPARQRTLRAALDWSHDLLDELEKRAFRRLAAFSGGFTLEAAEAVVDPFDRLERDVVDLVESLHDQSLLQRLPDADEEPRFRMIETIREYAAELLMESDEEAPTRQAQAAYFLVVAEAAEADFNRGRGSDWLDRFRADEANFRVALDWLIETDKADWGLRIALGLFHFWELGESFSEGQQRFDRLLALPSARELEQTRAKSLFSAGVLAGNQRDLERARGFQRRSLELYRRLGDRRGQAVALNGLGILLTDQGRYDEARACYEECLELWEELGESHGAAASLSNFAFVLRSQGELERSRGLYQEAAAMFERLGDPVGAAWETSHEADVVRAQNGQTEAEAARLYERALKRFRELEEPWGVGSTLVDLGGLAQNAGDLDEAESSYREALEIFHRVGHQRGVARVLEALATLAGERDDPTQVLRLAAAARRLRERLGRPPTDPVLEVALDAAVARASQRLGGAEAEAELRRGEAEPMERLVASICRSDTGGQA